MKSGFFADVYRAVKSLPKGSVATYGDIAAMVGRPKMAKYVGYALHANTDPENVPCYKIVDKMGNLAKEFVFGGREIQQKMLENDGIKVTDFKVDLEKHRIRL